MMTYPRDITDAPEISAIGPEWLTTVLSQNYDGLEVQTAEIEELIQGAAVKIKVRLAYNKAGIEAGLPVTMVIKGGFGRQDPSWYNAVQATEMYAYRDITQVSGVDAPETYFAGFYPDPDHAVILMEDLSQRNVIFGHALAPYTYDQAAALIDNLAKLHATWWDSPKLSEAPLADWLEDVHDSILGIRHSALLEPDSWTHFATLPRASGLPAPFKDADRMQRALEKLRRHHRKEPQTLVHGDHHIGNTYVDGDGRGGAYDWSVKTGNWAYDVPYFLANALDVADRREWERPLLGRYLRELTRHGAPAPSFEEAWWTYRTNMLFGLITWMGNGDENGQFQPEAVNAAGATRLAWAAYDLDTLGLLA
ncbi:phosphotransferase [Parasphingorhabdus sp.]|uniref:phosphotransferase n=1 Tax=Parasphingorhabdus sp. TaxID=2709688 RepID=UPI003A9040F1